MRRMVGVLIVLWSSVCLAGPQVVTLSLEIDPAAGAFQVFGTTTDDGTTWGISACELNFWTEGGLSITSLVNEMPYGSVTGFSNLRDDGSEKQVDSGLVDGDGFPIYVGTGVWYMSAAQPTIYAGTYNATKDSKVIKRFGQVAGSLGSMTWGYPALLASGTYTATTVGNLFVDIPDGSNGFSLLKKVTTAGWRGPGNEMAPASVIPDQGSDWPYYPYVVNSWVETPAMAEAGGPYVVDADQTIALDGTGSDGCTLGREWSDGAITHDASDVVSWLWDLDGDGQYDDASGWYPNVSFNLLANTLGLAPGDHTIGLKVMDMWGEVAYDTASLTLVPEPGTILLLVLGAGLLRRKA